jgi:hypothetical protein
MLHMTLGRTSYLLVLLPRCKSFQHWCILEETTLGCLGIAMAGHHNQLSPTHPSSCESFIGRMRGAETFLKRLYRCVACACLHPATRGQGVYISGWMGGEHVPALRAHSALLLCKQTRWRSSILFDGLPIASVRVPGSLFSGHRSLIHTCCGFRLTGPRARKKGLPQELEHTKQAAHLLYHWTCKAGC